MRKPHLLAHLRSTRVRAALGLGVVLALGTTGTFAFWTDSVTVTGQTLTTGTIDLQVGATAVGASDSFTTTTMNASAMVPGNTVAQTLVLKNHGNVPIKWTLKGGVTGTNAAAFSTAQALLLSVTDGTASSGTCSGSPVAGITNVPLTNVTTTDIIAARQAQIAGNDGTKGICLQIKLSDTADQSTLSGGKVATPTFTFTGTSDIS